MRSVLRRIRGAIGMGFTWALAWSAVGLVPRWVLGMDGDAPFPIIFGVIGFLAGVIFSVVLALTEGRRRFDQMSMPRFAGWGAVGGVLLSGVWTRIASLELGDVLMIVPTFAAASAACAAGSLALARRVARRELAGLGDGTADAELAGPKQRSALGEGDSGISHPHATLPVAGHVVEGGDPPRSRSGVAKS